MNIYIDILAVQNSRGKYDYYYPTAHWELNDCDTKSADEMNALAEDLNKVLRQHLTGNKKLKIEVVEDEQKSFLTPLKKNFEGEGETPRRESEINCVRNKIIA